MFVICYVAGYVARRAMQWCAGCEQCKHSLVTDVHSKNSMLIQLKSNGSLLLPSLPLEKLITHLETCVQKVVGKHPKLSPDYLFLLTDEVKRHRGVEDISLSIGCINELHKKDLSKRVLMFFLLTRMHFLCRNEVFSNTKHRTLNKMAKL
jgi:hypothetical protein